MKEFMKEWGFTVLCIVLATVGAIILTIQYYNCSKKGGVLIRGMYSVVCTDTIHKI